MRDTLDLSAEEIGVFNVLIWAMWARESCDLPDDDAKLARVARFSSRQAAKPGAVCIYHIGQIALDRADAPRLHDIALAVNILSTPNYLLRGQHAVMLASGRQTVYTVTRTGQGSAPAALMAETIRPIEYLALQAVKNRAASQSAARAIREDLGVSDDAARNLLSKLSRAQMVQRNGPSPAGELSDNGRRLVV